MTHVVAQPKDLTVGACRPGRQTVSTAASAESLANTYEIIDAVELANRWSVPISWIREGTRARAVDPIPHVRFGRYVRFEWNSPALNAWVAKRRRTSL